ncbi:hypothetical protein ACFQ0B_68265 [Nonomuraea thailandensis]
MDSVPAVYGVTEDPFLVFATNAFALLGLRALYFVLKGVLTKLRHLNHGLSVILAFIGVKLVLHWAHGIWAWVPEIPTLASLGIIVSVLVVVTVTSLLANRRDRLRAAPRGRSRWRNRRASADPAPAGPFRTPRGRPGRRSMLRPRLHAPGSGKRQWGRLT